MKMIYIPMIKNALKEDLGKNGDITTDSIISEKQKGKAVLKAKSEGILCGLAVFEDTFFYVDKDIKIETFFKDGDRLEKGDIIAVIKGKLNSILKAERTALNFIQRMSGISTSAYQFVRAVEGTKTKILDTRKTLPGFRVLDKYAVKTGGAENHRMGLFDMFLIKDNHIAAAGSVTKAVERALKYKKENKLKAIIEVEIKNLAEFKEVLGLDVDWVMLDNMKAEEIKKCVMLNKGRKKLEVSGNVTLDTVRKLALTGVDYISSGSLTHSVKALDLSLLVE
ncbi:MAG TPA: carboxylating nicotinate-nucleotide diphosphorylase [Clostridiales bacterium]|nr:carboxylating nicotinate-nucleotide diphosphorylase [Clostridiales bacterium]HQP69617.1 carboxylating nicotinate-nucleotide diphosphorylase [Clostridiales bacterium]